MNILELFSGIGGMHVAFKDSKVEGKIICAVDINQFANAVYSHNFDNQPINANIQALTPQFINKLDINTVLLSPPCQPFTRNGNRRDIHDPRTNSFLYFLQIMPQLPIQNFLLENVKGFETSEMHQIMIHKLQELNFHIKEFLLCPTEFGMPNSRCRYYCVARRRPFGQSMDLESFETEVFSLNTILEEEVAGDFDVPIHILKKHYKLMDIVYKDSKKSCCFTKSYSRYMEGTGSVLAQIPKENVDAIFKHLEEIETQVLPDAFKERNKDRELQRLKLRFFTPREILRLMSFPENYSFPAGIPVKQQYKLLGNSINCKVVASLIKFLNN